MHWPVLNHWKRIDRLLATGDLSLPKHPIIMSNLRRRGMEPDARKMCHEVCSIRIVCIATSNCGSIEGGVSADRDRLIMSAASKRRVCSFGLGSRQIGVRPTRHLLHQSSIYALAH